jgi:succinate dehydrogenase (ubiquinone) membrane anchor subunit
MNMPVDLALGILFPFHSHVALNYVITDYVPKAGRSAARAALLAATVIAAAGLLKLNVEGPGLTETIKSLWRAPKAEQSK